MTINKDKAIYIIAMVAVAFVIIWTADKLLSLRSNDPVIDQYHYENNLCRDGDPESPLTWASCAHRDILVEDLVSRGYCWGKEGQAEYEKSWQKCQ
jgi:hypothetical protein